MRFLLRNWHLKLSALFFAMILYTGLVYSGTLSERTISVPIRAVNQPTDSYNLSGDRGFVEVRYRTERDAAVLTADAFSARVDLSQYEMDRAPEPQELPVEVAADGIEILGRTPQTVRVVLDRTETRTVSVEVDAGEIPEGLELGDPELSERDGQVEVQGPASEISRVDRAVARILIDPSGIDFDQPVTLIPVDIEGQPVGIGRLELTPEVISVRVDVEPVETTTTVTVIPDITGTPAPGYLLEGLSVLPTTVTLRGLPEVLTEIEEVRTESLDITGLSADETFETTLVLPEGVRMARAGAEPVATVEVSIVGLPVASRTFVVGVVCQGQGQNSCLPALQQLSLTLSGPASLLEGLGAADLTPTVDVTGLGPGTYTATPLVPALPDGVEVLQLLPGTVTVRVVAPATPPPTPAP